MTKYIIKINDDLRVIRYSFDRILGYGLECRLARKDWVPLTVYDTEAEAIAVMEALAAASRMEMEYAEADAEVVWEVCDDLLAERLEVVR